MGNSERGKAESLVEGERSRYFYGFICGRGGGPGLVTTSLPSSRMDRRGEGGPPAWL